MKNSIAIAALVVGLLAAESSPTSAFAYDFAGTGIEADTDYIAGFVLLGADYRGLKEDDCRFFCDNDWNAVSKKPLTFHRKSDNTSVTVTTVSRCEYELKYSTKDEKTNITINKTIAVDFNQASNIELYDSGLGEWWLKAKAGNAFWCEKVEKNGMNWSNCGGLSTEETGRIFLRLNGGANDRDISKATVFFFNQICQRR
jgi:hypothetical protein